MIEPKEMAQWYQTAYGQMLLEKEASVLSPLLPLFPGQALLQIGGEPRCRLVQSSPILFKSFFSVDGTVSDHVPTIEGDLDALPLQAACLDVIVMAHVMAYADDPQAMLTRVCDALVPGGVLIILGFNPLSALGLARYRQPKGGFPWQGRFIPPWRTRQWLRQQGLQLVLQKTFCYSSPSQRGEPRQHQQFWESLGHLLLPSCGGVYLLVAQKRAEGMNPLVGEWLEKNTVPLGRGVAKPSVRLRDDEVTI